MVWVGLELLVCFLKLPSIGATEVCHHACPLPFFPKGICDTNISMVRYLCEFICNLDLEVF